MGEPGDKEMSMKNLETPTGRKERVPNLPRQALSEESEDTRGWHGSEFMCECVNTYRYAQV